MKKLFGGRCIAARISGGRLRPQATPHFRRGPHAPSHRLTQQQLLVRDLRRKALGEALGAARQSAGLTQDELAAASGVSRPTISRLEQGTSSISSDRIWDLAAACGTDPAALFIAAQASAK